MDEAVQEGAGRDDDGGGAELGAIREPETDAAAGAIGAEFEQDVGDLSFDDLEVRNALEQFAHADAVERLVALRARRPHGGATACVEQAKLDAARVGDFAHNAAEGVDLADQVTFRDAADGRVAAHLGDLVER